METEQNELDRISTIFGKTLMTQTGIAVWTRYLDFVRRRHNTMSDPTGSARSTVQQAFDFTFTKIGVDKDSGKIWQDYIKFVKEGPGIAGGSGWQDQQKMDAMRTAYRRALVIPTQITGTIWAEYTQFEVSLNKMTVRTTIACVRPPRGRRYRDGSQIKIECSRLPVRATMEFPGHTLLGIA